MSALWYYRHDKVLSSRLGALVLWNYGQSSELSPIPPTTGAERSLSIVDRKTLKEIAQLISFDERISYEKL